MHTISHEAQDGGDLNMSTNNPYAMQPQVVYQADQSLLQAMQSMRAKVMEQSKQCMHRPVRVQTIQGHQLEGTVVHLDHQYMYLRVEMNPQALRQFNPYYNPYYNPYTSGVILPLVLYELLAISLLS
jgi:type IV secretory pathway VirB9-like protein